MDRRADGTILSPRRAFYSCFIKTPETDRYKASFEPLRSILNLMKGTPCILHCTLAIVYIFTSTGTANGRINMSKHVVTLFNWAPYIHINLISTLVSHPPLTVSINLRPLSRHLYRRGSPQPSVHTVTTAVLTKMIKGHPV